MVVDLQAIRVAGLPIAEGAPEDNGIRATVGVEDPDRSWRRHQGSLHDRHDGGHTAAAAERHHRGMAVVTQAEHARRFGELDGVAGRHLVEEPVGYQTARDPLDRDREVIVGLRSARHRVGPELLVAGDMDPEGAELSRLVPEQVRQVIGDVEHEGAGVLRLLHDLLDPHGVIAVSAKNVLVVGLRGRRARVRRHRSRLPGGCRKSLRPVARALGPLEGRTLPDGPRPA